MVRFVKRLSRLLISSALSRRTNCQRVRKRIPKNVIQLVDNNSQLANHCAMIRWRKSAVNQVDNRSGTVSIQTGKKHLREEKKLLPRVVGGSNSDRFVRQTGDRKKRRESGRGERNRRQAVWPTANRARTVVHVQNIVTWPRATGNQSAAAAQSPTRAQRRLLHISAAAPKRFTLDKILAILQNRREHVHNHHDQIPKYAW